MKAVSGFSLLVFAPVIIAFLLTAGFLLPAGVLMTLTAIFDPTVPLYEVASYDFWVIGPILAAGVLFLVGMWLHALYRRWGSSLATWALIWAVFSLALFIAVWLGVTVLTSIGASETPVHIFLRITALMAAILILLAQALVIPWLYFVSRTMSSRYNLNNQS